MSGIRERWVYRTNPDTGECEKYRVDPDAPPETRLQFSVDRHYEGLRATDGTDIGSRRKHREYMRLNGLATVDDFKETWAKAERERASHFDGSGGPQSERKALREQIGKTLYEMKNRSRR